MQSKTITALILGALAVSTTTEAKPLSAKERQRLENDVAVQQTIVRLRNESLRDTERALIAARIGDAVIARAVRSVPGGSATYAASKAATRAALRRKN